MILWILRILLFVPCMLLFPTTVKGRKNFPKGKAILCCNHYSNLDIVLYLLRVNEKIKVLAKKELFKNRLLGACLRSVGGIPIDRKGNDIAALKRSMKVLKNDKKLFIFPEGTRLKNTEEVLGEIKSGTAMLAIKTKTPIVPIWIERPPKAFHRSIYHIGQPFELEEFYGRKFDEQCQAQANEVIRQKMLQVRQDALDEKTAKQAKKQKKSKKVGQEG